MTSVSDRATRVRRRLEEVAGEYDRKLAVVERLNAQMNRHNLEQETLLLKVEHEEKAQAILLALEDAWRKDFERSVEQVVTDGIQLVFGEDLEFKIKTTVKAGASAIEFVLETTDGSVDIMTAEGGSLVQVVSFLLRVLLVLAHKPALRRVVVLDEAFGGMSEENVPALATLLRKIVDESGIQLIMVTHDKSYAEVADVVYEVKKNKGVAKIVKL